MTDFEKTYQNYNPRQAALGVYLHGLSGDTALKKCGFRGMMAGDIVNGLRDFLAENQL